MNQTLFVGIDVSKGYADFQAVGQDRLPYEAAFRLEDTAAGYAALRRIAQHWLSQGITQLCFGVESTGGYENNWVGLLLGWSSELPVRITRLNPSGVTSLRKAGLVRTVTDSVSAEAIALYLLVFPKKICWLSCQQSPDNVFSAARKFQRGTATLDRQRQQLTNQLEKLLYHYFSPWLVYTRHGIPKWMVTILSKYPSPSKVKRAEKKRIAAIKSVSLEKADKLRSKLSDCLLEPALLDQENIKQTAQQILHLYKLIEQRHDLLQTQFNQDPQVRLLMSIPGVGMQTAVLLHVEIEDCLRFATAKKMVAYFGVCPKYVESGDKKGKICMSKQGRPDVRKALYMSGLSAIRHDEGFRKLYHRYRLKGYNHFQAIGVVMHKLLRVVYGILVHQTPYDPEVDKANQRRAKQKQRAKQEDQNKIVSQHKKRLNRYQKETVNAPRSRRSVQKLKKEQPASQSSTAEECTGSPDTPRIEIYENVT